MNNSLIRLILNKQIKKELNAKKIINYSLMFEDKTKKMIGWVTYINAEGNKMRTQIDRVKKDIPIDQLVSSKNIKEVIALSAEFSEKNLDLFLFAKNTEDKNLKIKL